MQQQVHRRQPRGAIDQFVAGDKAFPQVVALDRRHRGGSPGGVLVGDEQEAAGATGRVGHGRPDDVHDGGDQIPRREVLASAGALVRGSPGQQLLVGVALEVGARGRPVLLVDQVDDELFELGWILHPVLRLAEDRAQRARLPPKPEQDLGVRRLQHHPVGVQQPLPGVLLRHDPLWIQFPRGPLMRHLQEQQVRELLGVLDDPDTVVTEYVALRPELVHEPSRVGHQSSPFLPRTSDSAIRMP
jgi:hypothetical protein